MIRGLDTRFDYYSAESQWGQRRYLDISRMEELESDEVRVAS